MLILELFRSWGLATNTGSKIHSEMLNSVSQANSNTSVLQSSAAFEQPEQQSTSKQHSHVSSAPTAFVFGHIRNSVKPGSILVDWQAVDERKSRCPDEDDINSSFPFSQLWLRATTRERTAAH